MIGGSGWLHPLSAARSAQHNLSTGMLEWWFDSGTYEVLYEDLTVGRNSACQGSTLWGLFRADTADPNDPNVTYRSNTKFNRQYFEFIRRGAVRIEALSDGSDFDPIAFINADGGYVVVANAADGGEIMVTGLAAATYGRKYTTHTEYDVDLPAVAIGDGEALSAAIPDARVLTVYASTPQPGPPVCEYQLDYATFLGGSYYEEAREIVCTAAGRT